MPAAIRSLLRGDGLAHVVAEHGEADDQVLAWVTDAATCKSVHAVAGVRPDATFRVPVWILRSINEVSQFREEAQPPAITQELKAQRRLLTLEDQLGPFLEEAFGRQVMRVELCT